MARAQSRGMMFPTLVTLVFALLVASCQVDREAEEPADDGATPVADVDTDDPVSADDQDVTTPEADADEQVDDVSDSTTPVADEEPASPDLYPVSVTRTDEVEITIEERPEQIVSLSPGATETFFAIGAGDQLVAVDMFSDYPEETTDLPKVDAYQPDPEAIVDLDPDLVFVIYDADGIVDLLEDLDIQVLYLDAPNSIEGLIEQIRILGEVTGNRSEADELAASLEERVDAVVEQVAEVDSQPSVYHELDDSFFTVGPESFVGDLYSILGARNIAEGSVGEYPQLSEEVIIEEDPEVIILPTYGDGGVSDAVRERPGWDGIDAVENDRVYEIDGDIVSRPGPRLVDALEQLAELLYPEEFARLNDVTIAQVDLEVAA
jgi:iron complex transport system substrate-binding protein